MSIIIANTFRATPSIAATLATLAACIGGGIARIIGYRPTTDYVVVPTVNYSVLTRFSVPRLYARKLAALESITAADVRAITGDVPKLAALSDSAFLDAFNARLAFVRDSMIQTNEGDRSGAHRAAHDRCYFTVAPGIVVHYVTAKDANGIMQPVLENGMPVAESIMLGVLILATEYVVKGEKKAVNSGVPKLMSNAIERLLNQRSIGYRRLSLKAGNFDSVAMGGNTIIPADVADLIEA